MKRLMINISGAYVILFSLVLLGLFIISWSGFKIMLNSPPPQIGIMPTKPVIISTIVLEVFCFIWCFLTGICILDKREWARISLLILSYLAMLLGSIIMLVALSNLVQFWIFALIDAFLLFVIPIWFLIFFNTKGIRQIFIEEINK